MSTIGTAFTNNMSPGGKKIKEVNEATKRREQEIRFFQQTTFNGFFMEVKSETEIIYVFEISFRA
jgi:hypothetical protein